MGFAKRLNPSSSPAASVWSKASRSAAAPALRRGAENHAIPAEPLIGFVAGRDMERHQRAGTVVIEAAGAAFELQRQPFAEQALAVGGGNHPQIRIHQQDAGAVAVADPYALHDGAGLGFPVEMDRQHAERLAIGLAVGPY